MFTENASKTDTGSDINRIPQCTSETFSGRVRHSIHEDNYPDCGARGTGNTFEYGNDADGNHWSGNSKCKIRTYRVLAIKFLIKNSSFSQVR